MCDLWQHTVEATVPVGAIPEQIRGALTDLGPARRIKLYNAGSFFDPRAIPPGDYAPIAALLGRFDRVTVECHPALVGDSCVAFNDLLDGRLEVALGLETIHSEVLPRLNKGMSLDRFRRAAETLRRHGIPLRTFVLVGLPFVSLAESVEWCVRSLDFAFDCGSSIVSLIPTRAGNGALDDLARTGEFLPPTLGMLEESAARGMPLRRGRVFADLWDLERLKDCGDCFDARALRLRTLNFEQRVAPPIACAACGGGR